MDNAQNRLPWLDLYGRRPTAASSAFTDMLSLFASVSGSAAALRYRDRSMSYRWLNERSDELAGWFADEQILAKESRVAVVLQNVPEFVIATVAAWKLGCVPMPLNPMYQQGELARLFIDGTPRAVICHREHANTVAAALEMANIAPVVILTCDSMPMPSGGAMPESPLAGRFTTYSLATAMNLKRGAKPPAVSLQPSDTALLLYTSGTTGKPKGAVLSHRAVAFNSRVAVDWFGVRGCARILATAPLFHIVGFLCQMCAAFLSQGTLLLNHRFEAGTMLDLIRASRPTFMIGPITAYIAMMNHPSVAPDHFSSFDTLYAGGGPVPLSVVQQFEIRFGRRIASAYGMTETCAPTHVVPYELSAPVDDATGALSIGIPVSGSQAMIVRADGLAAAHGEAGELLIRGPMLMDGYRNQPEATAEALQDNWMHTGDIAVMNAQGWFFLIDRKKDVIVASGFKVWPREVEDVLYSHPGVREAAVIGVPDSYRGETIHAYVSLKPASTVTAEELIALCREQLAAYKAPRHIGFLDELPKTASGKIMRGELRALKTYIKPA